MVTYRLFSGSECSVCRANAVEPTVAGRSGDTEQIRQHDLEMIKSRINYYWRVLATGIAFSIFGIGALMLSVFFLVVVRLLPAAQETKRAWIQRSIQLLCLFFIYCMKWLGLSDHSFNNEQGLKTSGKVIIANHPSLVDALYLMAKTDNLCCIVKEGLWNNPFTSYVVRLAEYIPNHSDTMIQDAATAVSQGKNLLVFPEGTRNRDDDELDFKRGAVFVALRAQCEIVPVIMKVFPRTLQKGDNWYDVPATRFEVTVSVQESLSAEFCGVDSTRPITIQARQWNRFLVELYRERIKEWSIPPGHAPSLPTAYEAAAGERQAG